MNAGRPSRPPTPSAPATPARPAPVLRLPAAALVVAALLCATFLAAAPGAARAAQPAAPAVPEEARLELPADAARLVPPGSTLVVGLASLDAVDVEWQALAAAFGSRPGDRDYSLLAAFGDGLPGFADVVVHDRPLVVAVGIAGLVLGCGLDLTFIFPFQGDLGRLQYRGRGSPFTNLQQCGGYAALSSSALVRPLPTPTDVRLPAGLVGATVELGTTLKLVLPLVEIGLNQLSVARPDSNGRLQPPLITPEDLPAVKATLRTVVASVQRLDLAIRRDGDRLVTLDRLHLVPGSALAPGPQASLAKAVELTALLPPGADLVQVAAVDLTRPFGVFVPVYLSDMRRTAARLDPAAAAAYDSWYRDYLALAPLTAQPIAASLKVTAGGAVVHAAMKARDAKQAFLQLTSLLDRLSALPVPLRLEPLAEAPLPGAETRAYRVVLDAHSLLEPAADVAAGTPKAAQVGRQAAEVAQMAEFFGRLIPEIRLARAGDYLLATADRDRAVLAGMIDAARHKGRRGPVDPRLLVPMTEAVGPVQEVITGDLTAMWRWFAGLNGLTGGDVAALLPDLDPLPCRLTMSTWDGGFAGTFSVQRDDLLTLARTLATVVPAPGPAAQEP